MFFSEIWRKKTLTVTSTFILTKNDITSVAVAKIKETLKCF